MSNPGKISRLPAQLREEINQRLDQAEPTETILAWLNAHPDVKTRLAARFGGRSISKQNLFDYKKHCFHGWQMRRDAIQFAKTLSAAQAGVKNSSPESITDALAQWLGFRYLALAQAVADAPAQDSEAEIKRLHKLSRDVLALRRSERLVARGRLARERHELTRAMALHTNKLGPAPQKASADNPVTLKDKIDLMRYQAFGDAVLPLLELEDPQYDDPACLI